MMMMINNVYFEYNIQRGRKREMKQRRERRRIQDVVEVVFSNTFASVLQVFEDNLKEFLVSILCLCIQIKNEKIKMRSLSNERERKRIETNKQTNKQTHRMRNAT
jgi:hypothetical protein